MKIYPTSTTAGMDRRGFARVDKPAEKKIARALDALGGGEIAWILFTKTVDNIVNEDKGGSGS
jgi:hypothetical protein